MKLQHYLLVLVVSLFSAGAWALDLDDAKAAGLVGETPSGYLAPVSATPSDDVKALVKSTNKKRRQQYEKIAEKRDVPLKSVEKLAAIKAYEKTAPGHYIQGKSGDWETR